MVGCWGRGAGTGGEGSMYDMIFMILVLHRPCMESDSP